MKKPASIDKYIKSLREAIEKRHGEYNDAEHGLAVRLAAADLRMLDLYDYELDQKSCEWTKLVIGSTGQEKLEINPLLSARDKASRTCHAALDSLMLTPQSSYKKTDGVDNNRSADPMIEYHKSLTEVY